MHGRRRGHRDDGLHRPAAAAEDPARADPPGEPAPRPHRHPGGPTAGRASCAGVHARARRADGHDGLERLPGVLPEAGRSTRRPSSSRSARPSAAGRSTMPRCRSSTTRTRPSSARPASATSWWRPRPEAKDLKAQLDAGADFSELATDHSTDGSASDGGRLYTEGQDCPVAAETYVPRLRRGRLQRARRPGERAGPDAVRLAPHPRRQDARRCRSTRSRQACSSTPASRPTPRCSRSCSDGAKGDIAVNPRYGTWDPATATDHARPASTASTTTTAAALRRLSRESGRVTVVGLGPAGPDAA